MFIIKAFPKYGVTKDGIERQFGINHIGHFYLTNKLLPILKKNKTRIINISSNFHKKFLCDAKCMETLVNLDTFKGPYPPKIPYSRRGFSYYGISKLCNLLFTRELNKLYHKDGITALCVHPGAINTDLLRHLPSGIMVMIFWFIGIYPILKTIPQGAATTLRCVTITDEEIYNGNMDDIDNMALYFDECRAQNDRINKDFKDGQKKEIDEALWVYSVKVIQQLDYLKLN